MSGWVGKCCCLPLELCTQSAQTSTGQLSSGAKPEPQVYSTLLDSGCQEGEHAACFAELRRNFVNTRPVKLKNLILLVKHWYHQVRPPHSLASPRKQLLSWHLTRPISSSPLQQAPLLRFLLAIPSGRPASSTLLILLRPGSPWLRENLVFIKCKEPRYLGEVHSPSLAICFSSLLTSLMLSLFFLTFKPLLMLFPSHHLLCKLC